MKKSLVVNFIFFAAFVVYAKVVTAQHFIGVQYADKLPFTANVNGINVNSAKTGAVRIPNLSQGVYKVIISFEGNKYPPQNFSCAVGKTDESYMLKNLGPTGWVLKNIKSGVVITASSTLWDDEPEGRAQPRLNDFAMMLSEVVDDSDLLKPTVWVYSAKLDGADIADTSNNEQTAPGALTYGGGTKGVIKVSEKELDGKKEMVFYDFNATGGDTIHLVIPTTALAGDATVDTLATAKNKSSGGDTMLIETFGRIPGNVLKPAKDSVQAGKQNMATGALPAIGGDSLVTGSRHKMADSLVVPDTAARQQFINPFFGKDTASKDLAINAPIKAEKPIDSMKLRNELSALKALEPTLPDTSTGLKYTVVDTTTQQSKTNVALNAADTSHHSHELVLQPSNTVTTITSATDTVKPVPLVKTNCQKLLTDNAAEKLKHKIYLENDEKQMAVVAKEYLEGKCITVKQVKSLANFFLSDAARLNFFKTVYPFVYDYGNFTTLENYMIDPSYKEMFRAMLK